MRSLQLRKASAMISRFVKYLGAVYPQTSCASISTACTGFAPASGSDKTSAKQKFYQKHYKAFAMLCNTGTSVKCIEHVYCATLFVFCRNLTHQECS